MPVVPKHVVFGIFHNFYLFCFILFILFILTELKFCYVNVLWHIHNDILIVWSGTDKQVKLFLKDINAMHKDIKFTVIVHPVVEYCVCDGSH